jgi:SAM-dependent methyltransferase
VSPIVHEKIVAEWAGFCPICERETVFRSMDPWFRDYLHCLSCEGGSIPRERALMLTMKSVVPNWRTLDIHESSPCPRGVSLRLQRECAGYVATQFFADVPRGLSRSGLRCEDLERQTFANGCFDVVITQDVMEHVFDPAAAYREIWRTLRPGGVHVHTTPIYKDKVATVCRAERLPDGSIRHLLPAEYHDNPIDKGGSLVTFEYGYELPDLIAKWTGFDVEVRRFHDRRHGIVAEFTEVIVCTKR